MNSLIEWLNVWGGRSVDFALPILWQSSLLIAVIFAVDFLLRRKVRAAVRYSLWFVVFVKLLLPPTLALPTGAAWWLRSRPVPVIAHHTRTITVNYSEPVDDYVPPAESLASVAPAAPKLSREAWMLSGAAVVSVLLALWVLLRWRQIARCVRRTTSATVEIAELLAEAHQLAGLRRNVTLRVTAEAMSPAVCGLFRPVILLPQSLIDRLTSSQMRAVLLHELIHLRRRDVWVNCAQTLLQIVYWWHPLLWIANARMRRVREEAVDDAVMCALSAEAEVYAPTLLEVAKLAFARPLASLGLVGILESRSALRHRIERLLNFTTPRRAGVSMVSVIGLAAFTALAVPMGEPPARPSPAATDELATEKLIPYRATVNTDVFVRNLQARASGTLHTTNDDLNDILVSIMDGFGVDCTGERAIQFDEATGVLTAKNSSEALGVLDEVVKELNLKGGEHILNPPHGLKQVLIEGQFYLISPNDHAAMHLNTVKLHQRDGTTPWWELSPTNAEGLRQELSDQGVTPISSPRIQTAHGVAAELSFGNVTNNIQLKCEPYVHDGTVTLTVLARTTGEYAPEGKSWPDTGGHTNCAIFSRLTLTNGGTAMFSVMPAEADSRLVVLLTVKILEPAPKKAPVLGDLPGVGRLFRSPSNAPAPPPGDLRTYTFRLDLEALTERLKKFAEWHKMNSIASNPAILTDFLANAGIDTYPENSFFYREENGRADLTLSASQQDLQKAAAALGLNWQTEQALNEGKSIDIDKLAEESKPQGSAPGTMHYDHFYYKTNVDGAMEHGPVAETPRLVRAGKLLYQLGKFDEAELKFQEALAKDPNNQAAQYYLTLIKQVRARNFAPPQGMGRNVPGPGTKPDDVTSMVRRVQDEPGAGDSDARLKLLAPNQYAHTNKIYTSPARQRIYEKLKDITFDKIAFTDMQLNDVVHELTEETRRSDPDQEGIHFFMNLLLVPGGTNFTTRREPALPENKDATSVKINITELRDARLVDVLDAIVKSANYPIRYSILDYGIEFSAKPPGPELHTRTFRVDLAKFYKKYKITGFSGPNATAEIRQAVTKLLNDAGVSMLAPKSVFFGDRQGMLTVRATDEDLEHIESTLAAGKLSLPKDSNAQTVNFPTRTFKLNVDTFFGKLKGDGWIPGETNLKDPALASPPRQLIDIGSDDSPAHVNLQNALVKCFQAQGVDLQAPKSLFYNARQGTLTVRATDEDLNLIEQAISRLNLAPPEVTVKARFVEISDDDMFKPGFEWFFKMMATNGTSGLAGILTDPIFRTLLKNIDQRKGADLLNEGEVTTLSGRQANFQVIEIETNQATASSDQTTNTPFGTSLDVVPYVKADGYTIQLTLIPTIIERVEHSVSGDFVPTIQSGNAGLPLTGQLPIPRTRVRQVVANCTVWDGQTAVLLLEPYVAHQKNVVIFVTTSIIDPSGNRKNSDDSLQFAQKAVPPQPAH